MATLPQIHLIFSLCVCSAGCDWIVSRIQTVRNSAHRNCRRLVVLILLLFQEAAILVVANPTHARNDATRLTSRTWSHMRLGTGTRPIGETCLFVNKALARVCREAGARVAQNVRLADMNLDASVQDARRIEVVCNGLPLWHGAQLAVDATIVSPVGRTGEPRAGADARPALALDQAAQRKRRHTYPELERARRCRLVVFGVEVGGRWSREAAQFVRLLAVLQPAAPGCSAGVAFFPSQRSKPSCCGKKVRGKKKTDVQTKNFQAAFAAFACRSSNASGSSLKISS